MVLVFHVLLAVSATIYGGTVVSFAALFAVFPRATGRPRAWLARVYRSTGPILGLSMGGQVLGLIAGRFAEQGHLVFLGPLDVATWLVFAGLWFSSFVLEIWTMDRLRSAVDERDEPRDISAFEAGFANTGAHLAVNATLVIAWQVLRALQ
jgi:hypothetical protein